jgi:hypothetical protein
LLAMVDVVPLHLVKLTMLHIRTLQLNQHSPYIAFVSLHTPNPPSLV